jgi:hypothetical protein
MPTNGPVAIQGCAYRISRLAFDGSIVDSSISVIQDDRPLVKLEAKPDMQAGVEITPVSACGVPVISYKDCDRYKRWDITLTLGDFDPEQMELVGQGQVLTAAGSAGRNFADGAFALYENELNSPADANFTVDDVGRTVVDPGFSVAACATVLNSATLTTTGTFITDGVVPGQTLTGAGILAGTVVLSVESETSLTMSTEANAAHASEAVQFFHIPANTFITEYVSPTVVHMSTGALGTASGVTITLGAQPVGTIGYQYPHLLLVACPFGVSIEVWSKAIVRGTGFQGTTPYPSAGTPEIPGSPYIRTGIFRSLLWHSDFTIENKEQTPTFTGWAFENPNFGTGPADDWRESALPGVGPAVDTTAWCDMMMDFELPGAAPDTGYIGPGYQAVPMVGAGT